MKSLILAAAVAGGLFATTRDAHAQRRGTVYYTTPTYSYPIYSSSSVYSYPSSGGLVVTSGYTPSGTVVTTGGTVYSYPRYYNSGYYNGGYYNSGFYNTTPVYYSSPGVTVTGNGVYFGGWRRGWRR